MKIRGRRIVRFNIFGYSTEARHTHNCEFVSSRGNATYRASILLLCVGGGPTSVWFS